MPSLHKNLSQPFLNFNFNHTFIFITGNQCLLRPMNGAAFALSTSLFITVAAVWIFATVHLLYSHTGTRIHRHDRRTHPQHPYVRHTAPRIVVCPANLHTPLEALFTIQMYYVYRKALEALPTNYTSTSTPIPLCEHNPRSFL